MDMQTFQTQLDTRTQQALAVVLQYLPPKEGYQKLLAEAMEYSVTAPGKRLRPVIMKAVFDAFGGTGRTIEPFMAAMEYIHTYSLVHDDLPAMDNDMYRRGRLTTWKVYGDGMAVLTGDGLLNYAFETVLKEAGSMEKETRLLAFDALAILANKAGLYGMIGGQTADVLGEEKESISKEELCFIHENKTAALLEASMMIGAVMAGQEKDAIAILEQVASKIGLAFQIQDDILDVTSTTEELGKPVGSDEKNGKQTYVTLYGLETSILQVKTLTEEAIGLLSQLSSADTQFLEALLESLITRKK